MCGGCYEEYGEPKIVNDLTKATAKLIDEVYEWSCVGGNCHIVVDDWNLEDSSIEFCLGIVANDGRFQPGDEPSPPEALAAEKRCLEALKALGIEERASAMAIHEGWLTV